MGQLFEKFGLNFNLLIAQIINFGILFFVLYKFAYKPILAILEKRRETIESSLKQAKEIEERTKKIDEEIQQKLQMAKQQAEQLIIEAKEIGEQARNEILVRANKETFLLLEKAEKQIKQQKDTMMKEVRDYIVKASFLIVDKILSEKLDTKTKEQLITDTIKELPTNK